MGSNAQRLLAALVPQRTPGPLRQAAAVAAAVVGGAGLRLPFQPFVPGFLPFATFFPTVFLATLYGGIVAGLGSLIVGGPIAIALFGPEVRTPGSIAAALAIWSVNAGILLLAALAIRNAVLAQRQEAARHVASEMQLQTLLREFDHRLRNSFTLLQAISEQTARGARTIGEYRDRLQARIAALADAQRLLIEKSGKPLQLQQIVEAAVAPFQGSRQRISVAIPADCRLPPTLAIPLALALHELSTNAMKYGALSTPDGAVSVSCSVGADGRARIVWKETGGPPVEAPRERGFGSTLIENAFQGEPDSQVRIVYERDGVVCELTFKPLDVVPQAGVEPARLAARDFESRVSANSTTGA